MRAWPSMSRAHGLLYCDTTRRHTIVCANLCTPISTVCGRVFCHGQLCHDIKILCCDRNSPYPGKLYRDIELLCCNIISPCLGQLCRDINILNRDIKSSPPGQLCRDIKLLYRNTKPLHLATLCCNIKYSVVTGSLSTIANSVAT